MAHWTCGFATADHLCSIVLLRDATPGRVSWCLRFPTSPTASITAVSVNALSRGKTNR